MRILSAYIVPSKKQEVLNEGLWILSKDLPILT